MSDKEKKTWVLYLQRAGYVAAALTAIATLSFGVDGRYQKAEAADEQVLAAQQAYVELATDREEGDVDNQIEIILVEDAEPTGPWGAKGIGEPALIPTPPAIFGAIHHATGVRMTRAPATPARVRAAILAERMSEDG